MTNNLNQLRRSRKNRIIFGVCGGIAEFIKIDITIVRAIFILLTLIQGIGVILYIILFLIIPEEEFQASALDPENINTFSQAPLQTKQTNVGNLKNVIATGFIFIGLALLAAPFINLVWLTADVIVAVLLIISGVIILIKRT